MPTRARDAAPDPDLAELDFDRAPTPERALPLARPRDEDAPALFAADALPDLPADFLLDAERVLDDFPAVDFFFLAIRKV